MFPPGRVAKDGHAGSLPPVAGALYPTLWYTYASAGVAGDGAGHRLQCETFAPKRCKVNKNVAFAPSLATPFRRFQETSGFGNGYTRTDIPAPASLLAVVPVSLDSPFAF